MSLTVKDLCFTYPQSANPALDSVSFEISGTEYVALLGANGSGKSTLARCVAGLLSPASGLVSIDKGNGFDVPVAMVFQSPQDQIVAETAELDVAFGPENIALPRDEMQTRVSSSLELFSLSPLAGAPTGSLSSGQKQHLALAGVNALNPSLLILDEPTSMLAPRARESLLSYLDRFHASGGTVLHVTHDLDEAARAGRIIVLDDGHKVFDGSREIFSALPDRSLADWGLLGKITESRRESADVGAIISCSGIGAGPLRDFSMSADRGSVVAVTGEAGSGKSLLLEILAGLRVPESGAVSRDPACAVSLAVQESEASLFAEFVADDVAFGPRNVGLEGPALVDRVRRSMDLAGLPFDRFADRRTFSLSGGERRKAALAGIIAMDTPVVLLDEPSSALDARSRSQLLSLILALRAGGKTVIFTTNRPEECEIADRVISLDRATTVLNAEATVADSATRAAAGSSAPDRLAPKRKNALSRDQETLARLRKGAAGSWTRLDTPLHRLPPVFKYIFLACAVSAALAARGWQWLCLLIALECLPVALARYPFGKLAVGILKIVPWFIFLGVIQYLIVPDPLLPVIFLLRFIALYIPLILFVSVTSHTEIMYGMEDFLCPLKLARIPVRDVALVTGIVFRFIPLLYEEAARITAARIIRSGGASAAGSEPGEASGAPKHRSLRRGIGGRVASMASLFVPLVIRTLTRADRLASAVTARYYGNGKNSRYLHWKIGFWQSILVIAVPVLTGLLIFLSIYIGT